MRKLLAVFVAAVLSPAQSTDTDRRAKLPREIRELLDQTPAAPPELGADILLRLVEAGKIPDKKIKVEILEEAFAQAALAKFPMGLTAATGAGHATDSDVGVRSTALGSGLDGLSLRSRAIRAMLEIDRKRALELFDSIAQLRIPPRQCSDALVDRVDEFYTTLALLFERAFGDAEKKEGKPLELLESQMHILVSPAQLESAVRMILRLELSSKGLAPVLIGFSGALQQMSADDRTFTASTHPGLMDPLFRLAQDAERKGISTFGLVAAIRAYLVRHLSGARCQDTATGAMLKAAVTSFNSDLRSIADPEGSQIHPIQPDDTQPQKVEGQAEVYMFWSKPQTRKLLMDLKHLRFGTPEQQKENYQTPFGPDRVEQFLTDEQRSSLPWQIEAREYLNEVESWNKDHDETEENYFHEVCFIYEPLLELVPKGELWDSVLASYVSFLKQSAVEKENPPEWYLEFDRLLHLRRDQPAVPAKISEMVKSKGDLAMSMYVDLERLVGSQNPR